MRCNILYGVSVLIASIIVGCGPAEYRPQDFYDIDVAPTTQRKIDLSVGYFFDTKGEFYHQLGELKGGWDSHHVNDKSDVGEKIYCRYWIHTSAVAEIDMRSLGLKTLKEVFDEVTTIEDINETNEYDLLVIHTGQCNRVIFHSSGLGSGTYEYPEWNLEMKMLDAEFSVPIVTVKNSFEPFKVSDRSFENQKSRLSYTYQSMANQIMDSRATLMAAAGRDMVSEHNDELLDCNDREGSLIEDYKSIRSNSSLDACAKLDSTEKNFEQMIALYSECPDLDENGAKKQKFETSLSKAQEMISSRCN